MCRLSMLSPETFARLLNQLLMQPEFPTDLNDLLSGQVWASPILFRHVFELLALMEVIVYDDTKDT
jgi:hypothetical protein